MDERIRVGRPDVSPSKPSHVRGVLEGNTPGHYDKQRGVRAGGRVTAEWSTGINPDRMNPIDPDMPTLPPS